MTWDVPTAEDCPKCGQTLFKKSGRGRMKPFCVNPECENFLPEDKRGYYKKPADAQAPAEDESSQKAKKTTAKKTAAKKSASKKKSKEA
jgi:DNA topoisomerase-1